MSGLQFAPWSSDIELSFYAALASLKINYDKLDDAARKVVGRYEIQPGDPPERSTRMQVFGNAFTADEVAVRFCRAEGIVKNVNTVEEYKTLDRSAIMDRAGRQLWDAIIDGTIYSCPSLLSSFHAIFFADLKKYRFTYHFAFPALHSDPLWKLDGVSNDDAPTKLADSESSFLFDAVHTWQYSADTRQRGFFLAKRVKFPAGRRYSFASTTEASGVLAEARDQRPQTPKTPSAEDLGFYWVVDSISSFETGFFKDVPSEDQYICFVDPSTYPKNPGWMLRNLLVLIRQRWHLERVQILCYRDTWARRDKANSLILHLASPPAPPLTAQQMPKVTGWERNESNKLNSRLVDLAEYMDPHRLADQSVDLNLKLMKWRIAPNLDLDIIKNTKCLLLGAGTLGSYVSRNLLGWGVRKITFVDNGKVSFSNPVRQPLFNFTDCVGGGAKKADRAAEALREIYPGVDAQSHVMSVPMAGHPITDEAKVKQEFETLQTLIHEHDVIFLLMDTRESRWLPTVMGKSAGKIVMNAALGFDTYVVMRHGAKPTNDSATTTKTDAINEEELGCYFCNDVVAPGDSVKDQTLDQQCTVTRPGIAAIASALLVEVLISILQHPAGARAPAPASHTVDRTPADHPLGLVPHQIRGFLSRFDNLLIRGRAYDCCSACSEGIVHRYEEEGWGFVKRALNEKGYVEEVSGLAEVQRRAEEAEAEVEWDSEEEVVGEIGDEEGELV